MYLSVIIPTHNEEERLPKTLEAIYTYLSKQDYQYEILVVDNNSTDKTPEIVQQLAARIKDLKLIKGTAGRGKGYAVKTGMMAAQGDYRVFTDADNSTSIDQVEKMWPEFQNGFDIVIGSRDIKGAVLNPPQPWLRKAILGNGFKLFRKIVIGLWGIADTQCGFKGFSRKAAEDIFPKSRVNHFSFDPEVLVLGRKLGYKIKEVPVTWINDLNSKVKFSSIIKMALDLVKIKWNFISGKYEI